MYVHTHTHTKSYMCMYTHTHTHTQKVTCVCTHTHTHTHTHVIPWRRKWQSTPVFLSGEFHGQRRLARCHLWGCQDQRLSTYAIWDYPSAVLKCSGKLMIVHFYSAAKECHTLVRRKQIFIYAISGVLNIGVIAVN